MTVCEIFFKLKFSKYMLNISRSNFFGKFVLIVKAKKNQALKPYCPNVYHEIRATTFYQKIVKNRLLELLPYFLKVFCQMIFPRVMCKRQTQEGEKELEKLSS